MVTIEDIMLDAPDEDVVVEPMAWFNSPGPFEIEIGCGKGGFLLDRAKGDPDVRLLGIEWANKYFRHAADRMARWKLTNVRVMRTDASFFVINHLPAECVSVLHVYHPDPWPKKRHHKRRLIQPAFIEAVVRVLKPCGHWLIQSDHEAYFEVIRELLDNHPDFRVIPWEQTGVAPSPEWSGTNFEIKYTRDGRAIYRTAYSRKS